MFEVKSSDSGEMKGHAFEGVQETLMRGWHRSVSYPGGVAQICFGDTSLTFTWASVHFCKLTIVMFTQKRLGRVKNVATFSSETSSKVWIYACRSYFFCCYDRTP